MQEMKISGTVYICILFIFFSKKKGRTLNELLQRQKCENLYNAFF